MLGKTHIAVGAATALTLLGTNDVSTITLGTTLAAVGATLADVDTKESKAAKGLANTALIILVALVVAPVFKTIPSDLLNKSTLLSSINLNPIAIAMAVGYGIIGVTSDHRGFTHTIEGTLLISLAMVLIIPRLAPWFIIGYITHPIIDLLNYKPVRLTMFSKKRFALKLCHAGGPVDKVIRILAIVWTVIMLGFRIA
ncbi:metal-dependent hydrolase [Clostridium tertium]|uniref:metal-dependent hydrolase n=1 Tax=Clostridium tertium TaxID=1559 RepID=UPI0023B26D5B|nr:metal-dependent hydrolase [Clostridium tertium]